MAACSETDVLNNSSVQQTETSDGAVKFDVYAQRGLTRGGGYTGDITNSTIVGKEKGFGVFAYYTDNKQFDQTATPNFMYNQRIYTTEAEATEGTLWKYEPVKYWPNEFGAAAQSDDVDYLSFFAYAPYTDFIPTTGEVDVTGLTDEKEIEKAQKYNIVSVNKSNATGDPIIKYVVDTDPATSVDLLWGVAAENANEVYTPIDGNAGSKNINANIKAEPGKPFVDMVKPNNPSSDRLRFNLKHALAKVKFTIDYIADAKTPSGEWAGEQGTEPEGGLPVVINPEQTRIFVRSFKIDGWATEGALNLHNDEPGVPLWKAFDGVTDLTFNELTFFDGRKEGKEATTNGEQKSEKPTGLNENITETYGGNKIFGTDQSTGVTEKPQLLFGGDEAKNSGFFYVIPRGQGEPVNVTIEYDVETIDENLPGKLSDGVTHGTSVKNVITKEAIFGENIDFEPGYQYFVKIHIGMTSVKIEATVEPWVDNGETEVDLPDNQDPDPADEDADLDNKPSIEAGTAFNATVSKVKGVAPATGTTLTLTTTGKFLGSYAEVTVEGTIEGITLEDSYYVLASLLKEGSEVELLSITPPTADAEPVDPTPGPSRMTRADEEEGSIDMLYRTNIYVIIGESAPSKPDEPVINYYSLNVSVNPNGGGNVEIGEIADENKNESGDYKEGTSVTVTATASEGHSFAGWTINGEPVGSTNNVYTFTITDNTELVANFDVLPTTYTVTATGSNGSVSIVNKETGTTITSGSSVVEGTTVKVTATPAEGYAFVGWSDETLANPYEITVNANVTLTANFGKILATGSAYFNTTDGTSANIPNPVTVNVTPTGILNFAEVGTNFADEYYRITISSSWTQHYLDSNYRFVKISEFESAGVGSTIKLYKITGLGNSRHMEADGTMTITGAKN